MKNQYENNSWKFRSNEPSQDNDSTDRWNQNAYPNWQNPDRVNRQNYGTNSASGSMSNNNQNSNTNRYGNQESSRENHYRQNFDWNHGLGNEHYKNRPNQYNQYERGNHNYRSNGYLGYSNADHGHQNQDTDPWLNNQRYDLQDWVNESFPSSGRYGMTYGFKNINKRNPNRDWDNLNRNQFNWSRHDSYSYNEQNDRSFFNQAGDEARSWFGDEEAERLRQIDERQEKMNRYNSDREWM